MNKLILLPLFFLFGLGLAQADEQTDSLAFELKRRQILENGPDERASLILGAAVDLARDGYYPEALELIYELSDSSSASALSDDFLSEPASMPSELPKEIPEPLSKSIPLTGYIETSVSYDDYEFQDEPWSERAKAKLEWQPTQGSLERMAAIFQTSDHHAYFDFLQKAAFLRRMLKLEMEEQLEKRINQSYGDSLDRVYLDLWTEANTRSLGKALSVSIPLRMSVEQYRQDRFGSLSSRRIGIKPRLEAVSQDLRRTAILSWELQQSFYPSSRATNNFRQGPIAWAEWYGERINVDIETRYQTTDFAQDTSLYFQSEMETRAGLFIKTRPWLKIGIRVLGQSEVDHFRDSVELTNLTEVLADYSLKGSTWTVEPVLEGTWASIYTLTLGLAYSRSNYPADSLVEGGKLPFPRYLSNPSIDWKPSLGFSIIAKSIFLSLTMDYQVNTVQYPEIYNAASSRGLGLDSHVNWKIGSWFEIDFSGMWEHALKETVLPGRIQNLTAFSLGLTKRFP